MERPSIAEAAGEVDDVVAAASVVAFAAEFDELL
jgi:hypothetical protein